VPANRYVALLAPERSPVPTEPGSPAAQPVELRVHGVSGTSPESLLDRPLVVQVAGDNIAGFYRPRLLEERRDNAPNPFAPARPNSSRLEGYNWGGLTSGSPGRAFWLILLPFTLVNIAPRARPPAGDNTKLTRCTTWSIWYLSRLLALTLTGLFVLTAAGVGEDLIGWQCVGGPDRCTEATPGWIFTKVLGKWHDGIRVSGISPGHVLLLGALVPTAMLALLWLTSKRTIDRYEQTAPHGEAGDRARAAMAIDLDRDAVEVGLGSPRMWRNASQVRRLRAVHLQFGSAIILWTVLMPGLRLPGGALDGGDVVSIPFRDWHNCAILVPIAVTVYSVVVLTISSYVGRDPSFAWRIVSGVVWAMLVAVGLAVLLGLELDGRWLANRYLSADSHLPVDGLPGFAATMARKSQMNVAAQSHCPAGAAPVVTAGSARQHRHRARHDGGLLRGGVLGWWLHLRSGVVAHRFTEAGLR
jgi:hypothetical protein